MTPTCGRERTSFPFEAVELGTQAIQLAAELITPALELGAVILEVIATGLQLVAASLQLAEMLTRQRGPRHPLLGVFDGIIKSLHFTNGHEGFTTGPHTRKVVVAQQFRQRRPRRSQQSRRFGNRYLLRHGLLRPPHVTIITRMSTVLMPVTLV